MYKPMQLPPSQPKPTPELRLDVINGGVSYKYIENQLNDTQSPYMLNLNADDKGALIKRGGQEVYHTFPESPIHAKFYFKDKWVVHAGTKLYTYDGTTETAILTGLTSQKGVFFVFNDILYYLNGAQYSQWNGTSAASVVGYIPTLTLGREPAGGGTAYEDFNLLSAGFIDSFSGDNTSVNYQLSLTGLDATAITASLDAGITYDKVETTHFTVNRTTGVVTWLIAPATGTNNVKIKAFKTVSGMADRIKGCKYFAIYGGENDTRVFVSGNSTYKNWYWYSGLFDPTYWPENSFNKVGSDYEAITVFIKQYDTLIVIKERSVFSVNYQLKDDGTVSFPTKPINSEIGCDMPYTVQLINNEPVFANTYKGIHILRSSEIRDERNVQPISSNINGGPFRPGILDEEKADLLLATSVDYDKKYWFCVGSKVWVWDYEQTPYQGNDELLAWYPYDNINANCFLELNRVLYAGDRTTGDLVKFIENYNDFGDAINGVWRSKLFNFNLPDYLKTITEVWFTTRANTYSSIVIRYYNDNGDLLDSTTVPATAASSFDWDNWDWDDFTWGVSRFAPTIKRKPKIKKVQYFQIEFSNNVLNETLSLLSLVIQYVINRKIK
ncbi:MAG: hypothetical protein JM58_09460 [Peptococcaceae bacterium BICA1-8]|nr:MAG: hypothetical protein JM58_09460 [Peptococcaceae bacterium BICA1-8]